MSDDYMLGDEWAELIEAEDEEPIEGLGELPDCTDDQQWCQIVGPADAGGRE
jgi:hypothetical protein